MKSLTKIYLLLYSIHTISYYNLIVHIIRQLILMLCNFISVYFLLIIIFMKIIGGNLLVSVSYYQDNNIYNYCHIIDNYLLAAFRKLLKCQSFKNGYLYDPL